jgi:hypothetical protein
MKKSPAPVLLPALNKDVSAPALLGQVRQAFEQIPDPRRYGQQFSLPDVLMSGLAVFGLKYPSLLKFDEQRNESIIRANLKALYGVEQAPCDSQLRAVLDRVDPAALRAPFIVTFLVKTPAFRRERLQSLRSVKPPACLNIGPP